MKQKGQVLLLAVVIIIIVLFIPIPYYQSRCPLLKALNGAPEIPCRKSLHLGSSIWQRLSGTMEKSISNIPSSPTNETAKWLTYSDKNVSFKYPNSWSVNPPKVGFDSISGKELLYTEFMYNNGPVLTLNIYANLNKDTGKPFTTLDEYIKGKVVFVNGYEVRILTNQGDSGHVLPSEQVFFFTPNKSYIINLYYQKDYYNAENGALNQILSTFKFTN